MSAFDPFLPLEEPFATRTQLPLENHEQQRRREPIKGTDQGEFSISR
jgi:hypothetical protein